MIKFRSGRTFRLYLIGSTMALALSACGSSGSTRIASIGEVPPGDTGNSGGSNDSGSANTASDAGGSNTDGNTGGSNTGGFGGTGGTGGTGGGNTSGGGSVPLGGPILVTAGNAVIGLGDKHAGLAQFVNGKLPVTGPITGTVTAVLRKSGQTLVDLGNGRSAVLNRAGGAVGKLVTIDLGSGRVIGAPGSTALLGVAALTPTQLVSAAVNTPASVASTGGIGKIGTIASNTVGSVTGALGGGATSTPTTLPSLPVLSGTAGTVGTGLLPATTNALTGTLGKVNGKLGK